MSSGPPGFRRPRGRGLRLLSSIEGRGDSFVTTADGRVFAEMAFWSIMKTSGPYPEVERFRVTQETLEALDWHIVAAADFSQDDWQRLAALTTECLESDVRVGIRLASQLPETPSDKRRTVVSHVPGGTGRSIT